ncbi:hypothetical protein [Paenibacillus xylanexedens]|uniref:Uncharacterized protein n=2 Tax=Paenibacillus xylanexedens TaxID=528191 RepID=A0ABS4RMY5_PAEXY|nr:hypothetical protein [Paenibacillus xylanexedens]MBP2244258.1 hypothetical protein [Paenibacillus xylanexedens]
MDNNLIDSISSRIFAEIDKVRAEFKTDIIDYAGSNNTILLYCKLHEIFYYNHLFSKGQHIQNTSKLKYTISEIISWVSNEEFIEDKEIKEIDLYKLENKLESYFIRAIEVSQCSSAFLSNYANIFNVVEVDKNSVEFKYKSEDLEKFENINHLLITEYIQSNRKEFENKMRKGQHQKKYRNDPYKFNAESILNTDISLPDDYTMLDISIAQIKEFWLNIYILAYKTDKSNIDYAKSCAKSKGHISFNNGFKNIEIVELNFEEWPLEKLDEKSLNLLLEMFSYNGIKKEQTIHSSFITEPIIKLANGKYIIIPTTLFDFQIERYVLQVFDKHIGFKQKMKLKVQTDDYKREDIFTAKLNILFNDFKFKNDGLKIGSTDIDYLVYDENSETVVCFEAKWITEPYTPTEIVNKDRSLKKALEIQLPNYQRELESNTETLLKKAFGHHFNAKPKYFFYFALTNLSIGSGSLDRSIYKVINFRLLKKALRDTDYNILEASQKLNFDFYIQDYNKFIESIVSTSSCFGAEVRQPEFRYLGGYDLD